MNSGGVKGPYRSLKHVTIRGGGSQGDQLPGLLLSRISWTVSLWRGVTGDTGAALGSFAAVPRASELSLGLLWKKRLL